MLFFQVQDIKTTPAKAKIQDAVCYHHMFPIVQNSDVAVQQKTTMIVLLEDGSLRIYNADKDQTSYWLRPQFKPRRYIQFSLFSSQADGQCQEGLYGKETRFRVHD